MLDDPLLFLTEETVSVNKLDRYREMERNPVLNDAVGEVLRRIQSRTERTEARS
jgi:hypothetical protein